jgi:hypothetical protein
MSADRVFTFEELKGLNKKTDLHMLIDGKGGQYARCGSAIFL